MPFRWWLHYFIFLSAFTLRNQTLFCPGERKWRDLVWKICCRIRIVQLYDIDNSNYHNRSIEILKWVMPAIDGRFCLSWQFLIANHRNKKKQKKWTLSGRWFILPLQKRQFDNHQPVRIPPLHHLSLLPSSVWRGAHTLRERKSYVSLAMAILW